MNQKNDDPVEPDDQTRDQPQDAPEPPEPPGEALEAAGQAAEERGPAENGRAETAPAALDQPTPREAERPRAPAGRTRSPVAWLALLLALASLAVSGWLAWRSQASDTAERIAQNARSAEAAAAAAADAAAELAALRQEIETLGREGRERAADLGNARRALSGLREDNAALVPRVAELEDAIATLQGISAGAREAWLLAEAEYYLRIANTELALVRRPEVALRALELADDRLRMLANPALAPVRRALAAEMQAVRALEPLDVEGLSFTLASLAEAAGSLPLAQDDARPERPGGGALPADEDSGLDRALASVRQAFSGLVSVRRADETARPLMSPEAARFLEANLALNFETARLALLQGEAAAFRATLQDAANWIERYYDREDRAVRQVLASIAELGETDLDRDLPDVSESLELLRRYRARRALETPGAGDESPQ